MAVSAPIVTGTDFIAVGTRDIAAAERFWGEMLGLPVRKRWGDMPAVEFDTETLRPTYHLQDLHEAMQSSRS